MDALLLARAAAPLVPGASRLPWVAGGGGEVPEGLAIDRAGVRVDRDRLARYARVCGFALRDSLPVTFPHVLAFPLHLRLMADGRFPFPAVGLVHIANRIEQRRALDAADALDLHVRASPVREHSRGRAFDLLTEVRVAGEVAWSSTSTMLRRGGGGSRGDGGGGGDRAPGWSTDVGTPPAPPPEVARWTLPGDLGRRYAAVSGDANPIHLHAVTARAFGFPRAIAHGMWTTARALAQLDPAPGPVDVEVAFRRPILLPATVAFASDGERRFAVRSGDDVHLEGWLR